MGSRIENLIRTAVQTFTLRSNSSYFSENVQLLKRLASDITASDIGLVVAGNNHPMAIANSPSRTAPCTYIGIFENSRVSIGVFILKDVTGIPLHDHQGMHGILKTLYGNLSIQSYTPIKIEASSHPSATHRLLQAHKLPLIQLTQEDDAICLLPVESNLHSLKPINGPAAFLDILSPPYNDDGTNCFYYEELMSEDFPDTRCTLTQIKCPSSFWCDTQDYYGPDVNQLFKS